MHLRKNYAHQTNTQSQRPITNATAAPATKQVSPQLIMSKDGRTVSASNHAADMDIRRKTDGEPSTNQIKSGKLPQNRIDNMVSRKQQAINEKAKAKAAAAKAAAETEAEGNITQDLPMNDGNQGDTIPRESVGSKRNRDGTVANNEEEGTRTSVTHMGTDGIEVPTMGESAERQLEHKCRHR
jgi:hypothetical protein